MLVAFYFLIFILIMAALNLILSRDGFVEFQSFQTEKGTNTRIVNLALVTIQARSQKF